MDLRLRVVVDGVRVVEPAVVGVPLFAVHDRVSGVVGLRQFIPVLHLDQVEVAALFLTRVLLLAGAERPALDTLPGREGRGVLLAIKRGKINPEGSCRLKKKLKTPAHFC